MQKKVDAKRSAAARRGARRRNPDKSVACLGKKTRKNLITLVKMPWEKDAPSHS
jgi:hypothetical protein